MPLFSGTAQRGQVEGFAPGEAATQEALPGMELGMGDAEKYATRKPLNVEWDVGGPGTDTFRIRGEGGGEVLGYVRNADFPGEYGSPTRGELFFVEAGDVKRQGRGTALARDALDLMIEQGAETVNVFPTTDAGRSLVARLEREGDISFIREAPSGKVEYRITRQRTGAKAPPAPEGQGRLFQRGKRPIEAPQWADNTEPELLGNETDREILEWDAARENRYAGGIKAWITEDDTGRPLKVSLITGNRGRGQIRFGAQVFEGGSLKRVGEAVFTIDRDAGVYRPWKIETWPPEERRRGVMSALFDVADDYIDMPIDRIETKLNVATPDGAAFLDSRRPGGALYQRTSPLDEAAQRASVKMQPGIEMVQAGERGTIEALEAMLNGMLDNWDQWSPAHTNEATERMVNQWLEGEVKPAFGDFRTMALNYASNHADDTLLNYRNKRTFDGWLSYVAPYHFWYTRTGYNWARRLARRPAVFAHYMKTRDTLKRMNEEAGRRKRFEGRIPIPAGGILPDWMGDTLFVNMLDFVMPFAHLGGRNWDDADEAKKGLRWLFDTSGLRLYPWLEYPYQSGLLADAAQGMGVGEEQAQQWFAPNAEGGFGMILPQTNQIRALTAGKPGMPPTGLNIEAPLRNLLPGLPQGEVWDPYRTNRMGSNIAADIDPTDPQLARTTLMAEALNQAWMDSGQRERIWEEGNEAALALAKEWNWTPEDLRAAQAMWSEMATKAAQGRGVGTFSTMLGPNMSIEPRGERVQMELQQEAQQQAWAPGMGGSREAYDRYRMDNPAIYPRQTQYQTIPGEEFEGMEPGARANWLAAKGEKEQVNAQADQAVDAFLRERPWDLKGARQFEDQRYAALDEIEARYPMPEMSDDLPPTYWGMNPEEAWDALAEAEIRAMKESKPDYDSFRDEEGAADYDAYRSAVVAWEASLPEVFSFGQAEGGDYAGLSPDEAVARYDQRYDSPLEAAAKVYQEMVIGPTWDSYHRMKADGIPYQQRWSATVGAVGPVEATGLIRSIRAMYGDRWSEEELKQALAGVTFPAMEAQLEDSPPASGAGAGAGTGAAQGYAATGTGQVWYPPRTGRTGRRGGRRKKRTWRPRPWYGGPWRGLYS